MRFIGLHDGDGLEVLINLDHVESILELQDGFCAIVFVGRHKRKNTLSFYPMETYKEVVRKIDYAVEVNNAFLSRCKQ